MHTAARQQDLARLREEQAREEDRQRILNEERRRLVLSHIMAAGPEVVRFLPKGVLKEEDLDYLPEDDRSALLGGRAAVPTPQTRVATAATARRQILLYEIVSIRHLDETVIILVWSVMCDRR
jgi:hypothetical protein